MQAINLDTLPTNNGMSIHAIIKSIANENNFTDEDLEYEIPRRKRNFYKSRNQEHSK